MAQPKKGDTKMKRSECTVEKLKLLGYTAKVNFKNAWRYVNDEKDCNEKY